MTSPQSPQRMFNGFDEDTYNEAEFAHEINDKMRVPKRIKATGEFSDEDLLLSNQNGAINSWNYRDKLDMNVPDRIVVLGHNQHLETRSTPREIQLENSILPKNSGIIRVQTPPRVITLYDHNFPSASEESSPHKQLSGGLMNGDGYEYDDDDDDDDGEIMPPPYERPNTNGRIVAFNRHDLHSLESDSQVTTGEGSKPSQHFYNNDNSIISHRDGTPVGELTPNEEILFLRRHLAKLNRRILNLEISNEQRLQREKIVYCFGLAYFVLKTILWLNRN